ncbi:hypothetical protein BKA62DRAFT_714225 [Auriculariales sp. MPI-PUGE-AT-0066]|nr:hypothetical protein BKA62DRAFT_714225 [Auriculariales sp. MPI-PUGE-AT-0066]
MSRSMSLSSFLPVFGKPQSCSVQIRDYQGVVVLGNFLAFDADSPPHSPVVYGNLVLSLTRDRYVSSIVVWHVVRYQPDGPNRGVKPSPQTIQITETKLNSLSASMKRGQHSLPWTIQLPDSTPAAVSSSPLGRITHHIVANVSCIDDDELNTEKPIRVIGPFPNSHTGLQSMRGMVNELGPYCINLQSSITIGGYLELGLHLFSPPTTLRIRSIRGKICQTCEATRSSGNPPLRMAPVEFLQMSANTPRRLPEQGIVPETLMTAAARPHDRNMLAVLPVGHELHLDFIARLPSDMRLLPSTIAGRDVSPIKISHTIMIEIQYTTPEAPGPHDLVVRLTQAISLYCCGCMPESAFLPVYTPAQHDGAGDSATPDFQRAMPVLRRQPAAPRCVCRLSWNELLGQQPRQQLSSYPPPLSSKPT